MRFHCPEQKRRVFPLSTLFICLFEACFEVDNTFSHLGPSGDDFQRNAQLLKKVATVIAIGVGRASRSELDIIASPPIEKNVFQVESYSDLLRLEVQPYQHVCSVV